MKRLLQAFHVEYTDVFEKANLERVSVCTLMAVVDVASAETLSGICVGFHLAE